ncbi:helix-turn-helix domain-containing protein [Coralloluteibacterium stylophorae]|uniref:Winged helix-turn-helix domain-containing protein n=1 Tax=Coralloluteibacterium stylophorae TaxID=1776034 RepID=A0A8J7VR08_9GAMM|nr:helix-turn-helix domain-containing protein [Coralloluteibacterium stylophorae]MBS7457675.1 hypothetical protein [Coralloluteibacterium stylophorae]
MKLSKQAVTVLQHLRREPHLTSWQAEGVYRIRRLASRIDELRALGYEVVKETKEDATGQRYTRYGLSRRQKRVVTPILPQRQPKVLYTEAQVRAAFDAFYDHLPEAVKEAYWAANLGRYPSFKSCLEAAR